MSASLHRQSLVDSIPGDPNTFWVTGTSGRNHTSGKHPHELTITFPTPVKMSGISFMPRQNDRDHLGDVREYRLEASDDGQQWRVVAQGELPSSWDPQRIEFTQIVSAKQLRFTARSGHGRDESAALAELAVIYAGLKLADKEPANLEYRRAGSTSADVDEGGDPPASPTNQIPRNP